MQKTLLLLFAAIAMIACSQDDEMSSLDNGTIESPKVVQIKDGVVLSKTRTLNIDAEKVLWFKNEQSLQNYENVLRELSAEQRQEKIKELGITNRYDLAKRADHELDFIDSTSTSVDEFLQRYKEYEDKYKGLLVRNTADDKDLTLYVPDGDNVNSYLGNENLNIVVGNEVRTLTLKDVPAKSVIEETDIINSIDNMPVSLPGERPVNQFSYSITDKRKLYFKASLTNDNRFLIYMRVKKKMWYGTKEDPDRSYYFDTMLRNFVPQIFIHNIPVRYERARYWFLKTAVQNFDIGCAVGRLTGEIRTWTDMTSDHDNNGNELTEKLWDDKVYPKCSLDKAKICNIDFALRPL